MLILNDPDVESTIHDSVNKTFIMIVLASSVLFFTTKVGAQAANPSSYSLTGTIVSKAFIGAVIIDTKGEQSFYRLYEKLPDGMQIVEVRSDSISLMGESGTRYDIYVNHDMKTVGAASQNAHINPPSPSPETAISRTEPVQPNPRKGKRRRTSSSEEDSQ